MKQIEFVNNCNCIVDKDLLSRAIHSAFPDFKKKKAQKRSLFIRNIGHAAVLIVIDTNTYIIARLIAKFLWPGKMINGSVVHHKDFNPRNNTVENLQVMSRFNHTSLHHKGYVCHPYDKEKDEVAFLYKKGHTLKQLSAQYGCSPSGMYNRFQKWNIPRRPPGTRGVK